VADRFGHGSTDGVPRTWTTASEIPGVVGHRPHLVRTIAVALVVGTILFSINQLDVVLSGEATAMTWVKSATTYLVPFCVANFGLLTASRRPQGSTAVPPATQ
jgi:hypothetical protein